MLLRLDEVSKFAELLIKNGHDAKTVNEQQLNGTKDSILINLCRQENLAIEYWHLNL
ncbi:MAG: DUF5615 family PIN-like protein [Ignavibacteriaceae bacterium]